MSLPWTSGKVASNESSLELPGLVASAFASGSSYKLRVRAWAVGAGTAGAWSTVVDFDSAPSMEMLAKAGWIGGGSELGKNWTLPSMPVRARAYVTGLGLSELWLNGVKVGNHFLDPGEAVYDEAVLFVTHNITQMLRAGTVSVTAKVGNSKYGYLDIYVNRSALNDQSGDSSRSLLLVLVAEFADGTSAELVTGPSGGWMARHGPIVYDHLWHGEMYVHDACHPAFFLLVAWCVLR